jgi:hypothetical protein
MWESLFVAITKALDVFGRLLARRQPAEPTETTDQDAQAARTGTAAGAAANEASHHVDSVH